MSEDNKSEESSKPDESKPTMPVRRSTKSELSPKLAVDNDNDSASTSDDEDEGDGGPDYNWVTGAYQTTATMEPLKSSSASLAA